MAYKTKNPKTRKTEYWKTYGQAGTYRVSKRTYESDNSAATFVLLLIIASVIAGLAGGC